MITPYGVSLIFDHRKTSGEGRLRDGFAFWVESAVGISGKYSSGPMVGYSRRHDAVDWLAFDTAKSGRANDS